MKFRHALVLSVALIAIASPVLTQPAIADSVDNYIEILRNDYKTNKTAAVTQVLQLPDPKAEVFWPVYREYQAELDKLGDKRIANIKMYAANFDSMTDKMATTLLTQVFTNQSTRHEIMKKYSAKFTKVIGPIDTARLMHLEIALQDVLDLSIASELPLMQKTATTTSTTK